MPAADKYDLSIWPEKTTVHPGRSLPSAPAHDPVSCYKVYYVGGLFARGSEKMKLAVEDHVERYRTMTVGLSPAAAGYDYLRMSCFSECGQATV
jgi:hypothetical protein